MKTPEPDRSDSSKRDFVESDLSENNSEDHTLEDAAAVSFAPPTSTSVDFASGGDVNNPFNVTTPIPSEALWSAERLPVIIGKLDPNGIVHHRNGIVPDLLENGQIVYGTDGHPLRDFPFLPRYLSSNLEWFRFEAYKRMDGRLRYSDLEARMPSGTRALNRNQINNDRRRKVRNPNHCRCWDYLGPKKPASNVEAAAHWTDAQIRHNTTWEVGPHGIRHGLTNFWLPHETFLVNHTPHQPSEEVRDAIAERKRLLLVTSEGGYKNINDLPFHLRPAAWNSRVGSRKLKGHRIDDEALADEPDHLSPSDSKPVKTGKSSSVITKPSMRRKRRVVPRSRSSSSEPEPIVSRNTRRKLVRNFGPSIRETGGEGSINNRQPSAPPLRDSSPDTTLRPIEDFLASELIRDSRAKKATKSSSCTTKVELKSSKNKMPVADDSKSATQLGFDLDEEAGGRRFFATGVQSHNTPHRATPFGSVAVNHGGQHTISRFNPHYSLQRSSHLDSSSAATRNVLQYGQFSQSSNVQKRDPYIDQPSVAARNIAQRRFSSQLSIAQRQNPHVVRPSSAVQDMPFHHQLVQSSNAGAHAATEVQYPGLPSATRPASATQTHQPFNSYHFSPQTPMNWSPQYPTNPSCHPQPMAFQSTNAHFPQGHGSSVYMMPSYLQAYVPRPVMQEPTRPANQPAQSTVAEASAIDITTALPIPSARPLLSPTEVLGELARSGSVTEAGQDDEPAKVDRA